MAGALVFVLPVPQWTDSKSISLDTLLAVLFCSPSPLFFESINSFKLSFKFLDLVQAIFFWVCVFHSPFFSFALQSCDDILELKLDELISQLKQVCGLSNHRFIDHLTSKLSSLSSPDDLFNFFTEMRGELVLIITVLSSVSPFLSFFMVFSSPTFLWVIGFGIMLVRDPWRQ